MSASPTLNASPIKFGTSGWRGLIADDFTFANVGTVACAIARYVVRAEKPGAGVLVGYDTRYGSERFARAAAEVVSMAGMPVVTGWPQVTHCTGARRAKARK